MAERATGIEPAWPAGRLRSLVRQRLSREQVYRLVVGVPERLNLAALCDILDCSPAELVEPYVDAPASAKGGSAGTAPPTRPRQARVTP